MGKFWRGATLFALAAVFVGGCQQQGTKSSNSDHKKPANKKAAAAKPMENLVEVAKGAGTFNTLVKAVQAAGLGETLSKGGPFTVFAPTDAAFAQLPPGELDNLLKPDNKMKLASILKYHVVDGRVTSADLKHDKKLMTLEGQSLMVKMQNGKIYVDDAMVEGADIDASNGVIHVINKVLMPKEM